MEKCQLRYGSLRQSLAALSKGVRAAATGAANGKGVIRRPGSEPGGRGWRRCGTGRSVAQSGAGSERQHLRLGLIVKMAGKLCHGVQVHPSRVLAVISRLKCFLLMNTRERPVQSKHGLLTTVAYQLAGEPARYALEGSIAITGALVQWMRDNLGIISASDQIEALARTVNDNGRNVNPAKVTTRRLLLIALVLC